MTCGTLGVSYDAFGVLCGASVGSLGSGLAGCGISEMCSFPVFGSVFASSFIVIL